MRSGFGGLTTQTMIAAGLAGFLSFSSATLAHAVQPLSSQSAVEASGPKASGQERRILSVSSGDTLMAMLAQANVPRNDAAQAISSLREVFDPRRLRAGQKVTVLFDQDHNGDSRFAGLELAPDARRTVSVARGDGNSFETRSTERQIERRHLAAQGVIRSTLFEAGNDSGVSMSVMMNLIKVYSHEVDFQRDLQPGDRFELLYEQMVNEDGRVVSQGDILYASLLLSGKDHTIFLHKTPDGRTDYYTREGESVRRSLLRTPVDGARITSSFGMRRHPILGFSKLHKGIDFGAPTGTPIYAAGRGIVEEVGRKGGYGNYIRIRHNTEVSTAYAHMSRFAKGVSRGGRVEQGEIIGYVGSTGASTGPHLHYEVLRGGRQVNPRSIDLPTGEKLTGRQLVAFQTTVRDTEHLFEQTLSGLQMARTPTIQTVEDAAGCMSASSC